MYESTDHVQTGRGRAVKVALLAGYAALSAGIFAAWSSPATGYELSIYGATPTLFWAGVAGAVVTALVVLLTPGVYGRLFDGGLLLVGTAAVAVLSLPILRGYYFFGGGDSLTHLGWTKELVAGTMSPFDFLYPGVHTVAIAVRGATGAPLREAAQYSVVLFALVFLVFVTLCVRTLAARRGAAAIGLFAAVLFLPVNNVSVHMLVHPSTQTILFAPLVFYVVFRYVLSDAPSSPLVPGPIGALLALTTAAVVLFHPQQAVNVAVVLVTIAAAQFVVRRWSSSHPIAAHRPLYAQATLAVLAVVAWSSRHPRASGTAEAVYENLVYGPDVGSEVAQRSASLVDLGTSIEVLFLKLFLVTLVFSVFAGAMVVVIALAQRRGAANDRLALGTYASLVTVPLAVEIFLVYVSGISTQAFRFLGFLMAVVTILGAVWLAEVPPVLRRWTGGSGPRIAVGVTILLLLPLSAATVYSSPYIYQGSAQVTESEMVGYEIAFETRATDVPFVGIRAGPTRYVDATYGPTTAAGLGITSATAAVPPDAFADGLAGHYGTPRYLGVSDGTVEREVALYDGFRYPASGFAALDSSPGIDRVESTGEFRLYLVNGPTPG